MSATLAHRSINECTSLFFVHLFCKRVFQRMYVRWDECDPEEPVAQRTRWFNSHRGYGIDVSGMGLVRSNWVLIPCASEKCTGNALNSPKDNTITFVQSICVYPIPPHFSARWPSSPPESRTTTVHSRADDFQRDVLTAIKKNAFPVCMYLGTYVFLHQNISPDEGANGG